MPKISTIKKFRLLYVRFIHFLAAFFANLALFLHHDFFLSKIGTLVASSSTEAADVMWRGIGPDLVSAQKAILERTKPTCLILIIYENNNWGWKNVVWIINDCLLGDAEWRPFANDAGNWTLDVWVHVSAAFLSYADFHPGSEFSQMRTKEWRHFSPPPINPVQPKPILERTTLCEQCGLLQNKKLVKEIIASSPSERNQQSLLGVNSIVCRWIEVGNFFLPRVRQEFRRPKIKRKPF